MQLNLFDWTVVGAALAVAFLPAVLYSRRAGKGTAEFFASGRAAPWWLIGTSMVATTFSTDTPNLVTNFVRTGGVAENWSWWAFLVGGMLTVFFYARLWRRSGVLTDLEFYELRYSGRSATFVRGFRAIYLGLLFNCFIMATVTLAATKIASIMLGWDRWLTVTVCGVICVLFSGLSGLWGVLAADLIQFAIAMVGVFAAAWFALDQPQVGGLQGLVHRIDPGTLSLLPDFGDWKGALKIFIIPIAVQWWAVWYPGAEPGGGSYIAQRVLAARDERHALGATLWFNVAHYALRPWPWIIVALCSILVFPTLDDIRAAFPHLPESQLGHDIAYPAMLTFLPHGLLGLLIASLLSAYVSTMSTHLNWGASYLVHDLYRRFMRPHASERHLVQVSRILTVLLMLVTAWFTFLLSTAKEAFALILSIGAGTGLIYLLRWYWWRINAWSEIAAMAVSLIVAVTIHGTRPADRPMDDAYALLITAGITTVAWLVVTFITSPARRETLLAFYRQVRPAGPGWREIRAEAGVTAAPDSMPQALLGWLLGCVLVYAALFGAGNLIYGNWGIGYVCAAVLAVSAVGLALLLVRLWRSAGSEEVRQ